MHGDDVQLMHWPQAMNPETDEVIPFGAAPTFIETWKQMEQLLDDGRCKAIGSVLRRSRFAGLTLTENSYRSVSNFSVRNLKALLAEAEVVPAVNQASCDTAQDQERIADLTNSSGRVSPVPAATRIARDVSRKGDSSDCLLA